MKRHLSLLLLMALLALPSYPQDSIRAKLERFARNINSFNELIPQEKVYLHFDNTGYYLGETIWYKAYVFRAEQNLPTDVSRVLYVDLLNQDGFVVETKKLKLENGQADGDFLISDTLYGGFYEVRAYTKLMLNFGNETVFSRVFPVYDPPEYEGDYSSKVMREREKQELVTLKKENEKKSIPMKLAFFPEGGNLIRGLKSKVAFKATGEQGQNLNVSGQICRKDTKEAVCGFSTLHQGMGYFDFTPDGSAYVAEVSYNGEYYEIDLPKEMASGYVLSINNLNPANLLLQISGKHSSEGDRIGLIVSCRGKAHAFQAIDLREGQAVVRIPKNSLPTGVNQITLLDESGKIYAERLAFIDHGEYEKAKVKVTSDKTSYKPFEPVQLNIETTGMDGKAAGSVLSVSVRDAATEDASYNTDNLLSNLLLSSELKGFIENPAYYFRDNDGKRRFNLDLLMLTQGWRRYNIPQMAGIEKFNLRYAPEKEIAFSGTVYTSLDKYKERKILPDAQIKAWALDDSLTMSGIVVADKNGRFHFSVGDVTGTYFLGLQTNVLQTKGRNKGLWLKKASNILLDRFHPPRPKPYGYYETNVPLPGYGLNNGDEIINDGIQGMKGQELGEVTVTAKGKKRKRIESFPPAVIIDVADEMDLQIDLFNWQQDACIYHYHDMEVNGSIYGIDIDLLLNLMLPDTMSIDPREKQFMTTLKIDEFYRYVLGINGAKKNQEIKNLADAAVEFEQSMHRENTDIMIRAAKDRVETALEVLKMKIPADPCVIAFSKKINARLGLSALTKTDYIYDMPSATTNMFYLDYIDKIMIYTDKSVRDINVYKKPHESWIADVAIRYIPYEEKDYRRPRIDGIRVTKLHGYSQTHEFYSPDYSNNKLPETSDFRRTLYWNPNVKTNSEGKASVGFYNNSSCRQLTISAEGLTAEGIPLISE